MSTLSISLVSSKSFKNVIQVLRGYVGVHAMESSTFTNSAVMSWNNYMQMKWMVGQIASLTATPSLIWRTTLKQKQTVGRTQKSQQLVMNKSFQPFRWL